MFQPVQTQVTGAGMPSGAGGMVGGMKPPAPKPAGGGGMKMPGMSSAGGGGAGGQVNPMQPASTPKIPGAAGAGTGA
jgi:hypothetical protein